jgi:hypothetical protein
MRMLNRYAWPAVTDQLFAVPLLRLVGDVVLVGEAATGPLATAGS